MLKRLISGLDFQVESFARILRQNRSQLFGAIGPVESPQGFFYGLGLDRLGHTQSPEATLALMLKEYVKLCDYNLNTQISLIEYRIFGHNCSKEYPVFNSLEEWIAWRLPLAFPKHSIKGEGWTLEFYKFAVQRSIEHFA